MVATAVFLSTAISIMLMAILYLVLLRERNRNRRSDILLKEIRDDAEEIVREINQVTDRNIAILEELISRIDNKVKEADKRISLLDKKTENERREAVTYTHLRGASREQELFDFDRARARPSGEGENPVQTESRSVRLEVLDLHKRGFSPQVIARKTGATLGEIDLMIKLGDRGNGEVRHDNRY